MLSVGMRLPRKSRDKTRTLHTCVWCVLCDLMNYCMMVCMPCCRYDVNVCVTDPLPSDRKFAGNSTVTSQPISLD